MDVNKLAQTLGRSAVPALAAVLALATPSAAADEPWTLNGAGWGHGVGMSQYGAMEMARDGYTAPQILAHYYTGTTYDLVPDTAVISVNLLNNVASATMTTTVTEPGNGGGAVTVTGGPEPMRGTLGAVLTARAPSGGTGVTITCPTCTPVTTVSGSRLTVTWDDDRTLLAMSGRSYRDGRVSVTRSGTTATINVVAQVRIHDEYLDYIAEVPWSWPAEALKAQAAAARGYALAAFRGGIRANCDCHLFNTTVSQVFAGYPSAANLPYWSRWTGAVRAAGSATQGYVVRHNGNIISAFYSSSSGGRTQNNEDVWGGAALPYLRSVNDPWSLRAGNPRRSWVAVREPAALASAFGLSNVARLDLSRRHASTGVAQATATSTTGARATITGEQLKARLGLNSTYISRQQERRGGATRYDTAAQLAADIPLTATSVLIGGGAQENLVDASMGGPLAGVLGAPILLTRREALPPATIAELNRRGATVRTAYVLGGELAVSETVVAQLRARGLTVIRLGGATRYDTSRIIAREIAKHRPVTRVAVAAGHAVADAVSVSGPSAALGIPILLTAPTTLSAATSASLAELNPSTAYLVGAWVTGGAESAIRSRVPTVTRLSGATRYDTSAAVTRHFAPQLPGYDRVIIGSGLEANLVDGIVAGALKQPTLLVRPTAAPAVAVETIQRLPGARTVVATGVTGVVSDQVLQTLARS